MASKKNNKTIIVTGDSRGLGKQTRLLLESKGYDVIGISRNSSDIKFDFKNVEGIKELYFDEVKKGAQFTDLLIMLHMHMTIFYQMSKKMN